MIALMTVMVCIPDGRRVGSERLKLVQIRHSAEYAERASLAGSLAVLLRFCTVINACVCVSASVYAVGGFAVLEKVCVR